MEHSTYPKPEQFNPTDEEKAEAIKRLVRSETPLNKRIFILEVKKSKKYENTTYCIGVFKLGTPFMEFVLGETDYKRVCKKGEEVSYVYNADYTSSLQNALDWFNSIE